MIKTICALILLALINHAGAYPEKYQIINTDINNDIDKSYVSKITYVYGSFNCNDIKAIGCYRSYSHEIIVDASLKRNDFNWVFAHEYGHALYGDNETIASNFASLSVYFIYPE